MNLNVPSMNTYPTDPASYLQRLTNGASTGSTQDVLKDLIGLISQLLKQMQAGQNGQAGGMPGGAGGAGGMPGGTPGGMAGGGAGAMPGGVGATPGGMGGAGGRGGAGGSSGGTGSHNAFLHKHQRSRLCARGLDHIRPVYPHVPSPKAVRPATGNGDNRQTPTRRMVHRKILQPTLLSSRKLALAKHWANMITAWCGLSS